MFTVRVSCTILSSLQLIGFFLQYLPPQSVVFSCHLYAFVTSNSLELFKLNSSLQALVHNFLQKQLVVNWGNFVILSCGLMTLKQQMK